MNQPVNMSEDELIYHLTMMLEGVKSGDTLEGSIEFLLALPDPCDKCDGLGVMPDMTDSWCDQCGGNGMGKEPEFPWMVRGVYRLGQTMGQGSVRIIGTSAVTNE